VPLPMTLKRPAFPERVGTFPQTLVPHARRTRCQDLSPPRDDPQHEGPSKEDAVSALSYQSTGCCGGGPNPPARRVPTLPVGFLQIGHRAGEVGP
jgi:hypothetical protein